MTNSSIENEDIVLDTKTEIVEDIENAIESGSSIIPDNNGEVTNPYELILKIAGDKDIEIENIELHKITNEYIAYIKQMNLVDWEQASEFLTVAATLLEIKAKHLLPQETIDNGDEDEESSEEMLKRKLEEYKLFKEACEQIRPMENNDHFYKAPEENVEDVRYVLGQMTMDNLLDAFTRMMMKIKKQERVALERKIQNDRFTVADKMTDIQKYLLEKEECMFSTLFDVDYSKSEIISTFQALLELMKLHFLHAVQNNNFDDIKLTLNKETQMNKEVLNGQVAN